MKKFIFAAYTMVLIALIPALFFAYLNDGQSAATGSSAKQEFKMAAPETTEAANYPQELVFVLKSI